MATSFGGMFCGIFLELKKSPFFLVARPLPPPPLVTGHLENNFFTASLTEDLSQPLLQPLHLIWL